MAIFIFLLNFIFLLFISIKVLGKYYKPSYRNELLDAFRGLLAPLVFIHHFILTYYWKTEGGWARPNDRLVSNLGSIPVSLFFMITGYLFIKKISSTKVSWVQLLINRVLRVYPMYLLLIILIYITFLCLNKHTTNYHDVINSLRHGFSFILSPISGFNIGRVIAGAQWTLAYEAIFYFSLPIIYILISRKLSLISIVSSIPFFFVLNYFHKNTIIFNKLFILFAIGGACWYFSEKYSKIINSSLAGLLSLIITTLSFLLTDSYSYAQMIIVGMLFILVCSGNDMLGLLRAKGLVVLGDMSYSFYLTHGIIIYYAFSVFKLQETSLPYLYTFSALLPVIMALIILLSYFTNKIIEQPFIRLSRKIK
ncbi:acyltransferase [Erwinia rhapontici]|uniref:acyltransferase family protein n=1 Tax=Erwinia rhapontici TaxID=55212 RepID=UPI0014383F38|nr:acyltransferase [Erwinia rhapontici]NKG29799.1 acyltransferase [Erwinia rhapontici]